MIVSFKNCFNDCFVKSLPAAFMMLLVFLLFYLSDDRDDSLENVSAVVSSVSTIVSLIAILVWRKFQFSRFAKTSKKKEVYPYQTVSKIFLGKQEQRFYYSYIFLSVGGFTYYLASAYFEELDVNAVFVFIALYFVVFIKERVFSYRIYNGFFGRTPYEAKQLFEFMLRYQDDIDFRDGPGKPKKVLESTTKQAEKSVGGADWLPVGAEVQ